MRTQYVDLMPGLKFGEEYRGKDYYAVLGVQSSARTKDIKYAFRKLAKQNHPDVNSGSKEAEEKMRMIIEAYSVLVNRQRRSHYNVFYAVSRGETDYARERAWSESRKKMTQDLSRPQLEDSRFSGNPKLAAIMEDAKRSERLGEVSDARRYYCAAIEFIRTNIGSYITNVESGIVSHIYDPKIGFSPGWTIAFIEGQMKAIG